MDLEPSRPSRARENMLAVFLCVLVGGMFLFFLYLITLGIVGNVLGIAGLLVLVGMFHYVVWGRSFSEDVAAEREALKRKDEVEARAKEKMLREGIQDISRTQGIQKM